MSDRVSATGCASMPTSRRWTFAIGGAVSPDPIEREDARAAHPGSSSRRSRRKLHGSLRVDVVVRAVEPGDPPPGSAAQRRLDLALDRITARAWSARSLRAGSKDGRDRDAREGRSRVVLPEPAQDGHVPVPR